MKQHCTEGALITLVQTLEAELSAQSFTEQHEKRQPQGKVPNPELNAMSKSDKKPLCPHFNKDDGCLAGSNCPLCHPKVQPGSGRCFNCGSLRHSVVDCTRPKGKVKGKGQGSKGKGQSKGKGKEQKGKGKDAKGNGSKGPKGSQQSGKKS